LGPYNFEDDFFEAFNLMKAMVEEMYEVREKDKEECASEKVEPVKEEGGGNEGGPSKLSSPSSSSSSSSEGSKNSSHTKNPSKKSDHNIPLLKLNVKFELLTYDGELNVEKLDNWIKQIEVYCRVQKIVDDTEKIQLSTLRLNDTSLGINLLRL
jgi:hypothetical protein